MDTPSTKPAEPKQSSVGDRAMAAMRAAGAGAEKTKIRTTTLPTAYAALGRHCYEERRFIDDFPDNHEAIAKLSRELKDAKRNSIATISGDETAIGKARQLASRGVEAARAEKLKLQLRLALASLGKSVHTKHGANSGPPEIVSPIALLCERLSSLDDDVTKQVEMSGGKKRLLMIGGGVLAVVVLFFGASFSAQEPAAELIGELKTLDYRSVAGMDSIEAYFSAEAWVTKLETKLLDAHLFHRADGIDDTVVFLVSLDPLEVTTVDQFGYSGATGALEAIIGEVGSIQRDVAFDFSLEDDLKQHYFNNGQRGTTTWKLVLIFGSEVAEITARSRPGKWDRWIPIYSYKTLSYDGLVTACTHQRDDNPPDIVAAKRRLLCGGSEE